MNTKHKLIMFCLKNLKLNLTGPKSKLIGFYETLGKINLKIRIRCCQFICNKTFMYS